MKKPQEYHDRIHALLAKEFDIDPDTIKFIRGTTRSKFFKQDQLKDFLIEKLKIPLLGERRITLYKTRLAFLGSITEKQFEHIVTYDED